MMSLKQTPVGLHAPLKISVYSVVFFFIGIFVFGFLASDQPHASRKDLED